MSAAKAKDDAYRKAEALDREQKYERIKALMGIDDAQPITFTLKQLLDHEKDHNRQIAQRPRKHVASVTHRDVTTKAMRMERRKHRSLSEFVPGEHATVTVRSGGTKGYIVECDSIFDRNGTPIPSIEVSYRQLRSWWNRAAKAPT